MKRLFRLFLCLALLSGTAACSDDEVSQNLIVINGGEHFLSPVRARFPCWLPPRGV